MFKPIKILNNGVETAGKLTVSMSNILLDLTEYMCYSKVGVKNMVMFLNIDGVLNRKQDWEVPFSLHQPCVDAFKEFLSEVRCVRIILISSWRHGFLSCRNENNDVQVRKLEKALMPYRIVGKTIKGTSKEAEIKEFVEKRELERYVVIDNDTSEYSSLEPYVCSCKTGWTPKDTKKCLELLSRE